MSSIFCFQYSLQSKNVCKFYFLRNLCTSAILCFRYFSLFRNRLEGTRRLNRLNKVKPASTNFHDFHGIGCVPDSFLATGAAVGRVRPLSKASTPTCLHWCFFKAYFILFNQDQVFCLSSIYFHPFFGICVASPALWLLG